MDSKHVTFDFLDSMSVNQEFKGIQLQTLVCQKVNQIHYPDTILRYMREWRKANPEYNVILVSKRKSIYRKVKRA